MLPVPVRSAPRHTPACVQQHESRGAAVALIPKSRTKLELRERQLLWLQELLRVTGLKPSQAAEKAQLSDTTLTRFLRADYDGTLTQLVIDQLKETFKVPGPEEYGSPRRGLLGGFGEAERVVQTAEPPAIVGTLKALMNGRSSIDVWRLKTTALEQVGYLPGDLVFVDLNAIAQPQDAVCAQVIDWTRGGHETVWRVFDPPFLVGAGNERTAYKPLLVDNERVVIKGVVVESFRPHRLSATR
jgi:hypothetical protein